MTACMSTPGVIERCERQGGALTHASGEGDVGQDDEDADEKDLEDHQHAVDARGALMLQQLSAVTTPPT